MTRLCHKLCKKKVRDHISGGSFILLLSKKDITFIRWYDVYILVTKFFYGLVKPGLLVKVKFKFK